MTELARQASRPAAERAAKLAFSRRPQARRSAVFRRGLNELIHGEAVPGQQSPQFGKGDAVAEECPVLGDAQDVLAVEPDLLHNQASGAYQPVRHVCRL